MPTMDDAMPEPGTAEQCSFCGVHVTLRPAEVGRYAGWYYWAADGEAVDGRRRCDGRMPRRHDGNLMTYHVPFPAKNGVRRIVRYDPDGRPRPM